MANGFTIGKMIATQRVWGMINENKTFGQFVGDCLSRYSDCDWGDSLPEHCIENDRAVRNGGRVMAMYHIPTEIEEVFEDELWFITEADRSTTMVTFISDY